MPDRDLQDTEILAAIEKCGENGVDPRNLIASLAKGYEMANVIEALQRAIECGKISLSSEGMVVSLVSKYAHAA